ncbi:MAG: EamA family transporter [Chloroflexota bacterium]
MAIDQRSTGNATPDARTLAAYMTSTVLAGANAVAVRFTVAELPPLWGAGLRFAAAALIFWTIAALQRSAMPRGRALTGIVMYGVLSFGVGYAFLYWGLQSVQAGLTQVVLALTPLFTVFFAFLHGLEAFRWRGIAGALLALAGIAYAFFEQPAASTPLLALLAIVAGAACFAESFVLIKKVPSADPVITNALGMAVGSAILLLTSRLFGESWRLPVLPATWLSTGYLVLVGSVIVFYLFVYVVRRWTASASAYQAVLMPFVTVLLAGWLAGEIVNGAFLLGGALVLVGVWIGAFSQPSRPRVPEAAVTAAGEAD